MWVFFGLLIIVLLLYGVWHERLHLKRERVLSGGLPFVIGSGLSRTGTSSLTTALKELGWTAFHFPFRFHEFRVTYCTHYNALVDWALLGVRPCEMRQLFPGAVFVHTHREKGAWLRSMQKLELIFKCCALLPQAKFLQTFHQIYGETSLQWSRFYDEYEAEVRERLKPDLVLQICAGTGWQPLCAHFGLPIPPRPFPHTAEIHLQLQQLT